MSAGWGTPAWMSPGPDVGETFVQGKTQQTAKALLAAADELGVNRNTVRAITGGFLVPNEVWDIAEQTLTTEKF